jgi:hypothetical protein
MSVLHKHASAGLIALTVLGSLASTAQAGGRHHHNDDVLVGVAAGLAGGLIGGAIASQPRPVYVEPDYYEPPPRPIYRRTHYREAPRCHFEWVEDEWGDAYRARVCY